MSNPRSARPWQDGAAAVFESGDLGDWERKRDAIREIIRAEVDRARPIEDARRSIELIVETSIRPMERDGETRLLVLDDQRRPRTTEENGTVRDFTVRDLVQELRSKHPKLFQEQSQTPGAMPGAPPHSDPASEPGGSPMPGDSASSGAEAARRPEETAPERRDWLDLTTPNAAADLPEPQTPSPRVALTTKLRSLERARQQPAVTPQPPEARSTTKAAPRADPSPHPTSLAHAGDPSPFAGLDLDVRHARPFAPDSARRESSQDLLLPHSDEEAEPRPRRRVAALAGLVLLLAVSALAYWGFATDPADEPPVQDVAAAPPQPTQELGETSSIEAGAPQEPSPVENASAAPGPLQGVPEVLDTATLFLQGKIVPLFGVEWVRGAGSPEDLARYINGREVVCEEATPPGSYRCTTGAQDLSKVVLYNGGGRAKAEATPELKAAENAARGARRGVWASSVGGAQP